MTRHSQIAVILSRIEKIKAIIFEDELRDFNNALNLVFDTFKKDIDRIEQDQRVIEIIKKKRHDNHE